MSATQIILLERVENLGQMGDVVNVKPGYARNYLLPQKKALRASKENMAYFDAQKKHLQAESDKLKKEAEKVAKKIEGMKVPLIRQASEGGQLFGSVNARDISTAVKEASGEAIEKTMVSLNQNIKIIGLIPVSVVLHPEVKATVIVNIARSVEESKIQAETGRALIAGHEELAKKEKAEEVVLEAQADAFDAPTEAEAE
jgi:large subunit ribosomal protein L9